MPFVFIFNVKTQFYGTRQHSKESDAMMNTNLISELYEVMVGKYGRLNNKEKGVKRFYLFVMVMIRKQCSVCAIRMANGRKKVRNRNQKANPVKVAYHFHLI